MKAAEVLALGIMLGVVWYFGYAFDGPFTPFLLYAGFGLINAGVNLAVLPGPHRIRIAFMVSLAVFTAYILWRRQRFTA